MAHLTAVDLDWVAGDVVSLAANVDAGKIAVAKNGGAWDIVFDDDAIKRGVYPAFSFGVGGSVRYNLDGAAHGAFRHEPPPPSTWE